MRLFEVIFISLISSLSWFHPMNGSPQPQQHQRQPLRSIQLGGTGVRAVTPSPSFSQQLAFIRQFQQQPQQNQKTQQSPPIYRTQAAAQPQPQAQRLQPTYVQQQQQRTLPQLGSIPPFQSRGRSPSAQAQQPLLLRSPQRPTTPPSPDEYEDEYEDEEYEDEPEPVVRTQQVTQIRPIQLSLTPRPTPQQRQQVRITPQFQSSRATPVGPSRFSPSQPQPQQNSRRPVQRQPQQQQQILVQQQPIRQYGQDSRLVDGNRQPSTPPPVKTLDRYMRVNEDGSTSWGYTNEDGTFKEETIGVDCVVRGKYGYVDPEGVKREYEYQSGNPCDPNKRDEYEEDEDEDGVEQRQRLGGLLQARPYQPQYQPQQQFRQQRSQAQQQQ